ncbi:MAG: DNA repair protein RecN [Candidatus Nanopelagicales bacterium]|jgi:DNA repair protein RecN (Recombination protein N)|nr:DNA repair protein RecN [Candidatus Nanopelagicales bacterium]
MLESLTISDLGIISAASIELDPGLTVLTGETGAGKSMILQSIGLIMGNRASAELVLESAERARVDCEVRFSGADGGAVLELVEQGGGECEEIVGTADFSLLISREINQSGRGKVFLGGRPVAASVLREVSENLIALHGQSDQVLLRDFGKQLELLDRAGGEPVSSVKTRYQMALRDYRRLRKEHDQLLASESDQQARVFVLEQGIKEISELSLAEGEDAQAAQKISVMRNVDDLNGAVGRVRELLTGVSISGQEPRAASVLDQMGEASKSLEHAGELDTEVISHLGRMVSLITEISDLDSDLGHYLAALGSDPQELADLENRVSQLSAIKKKYGPSLVEVMDWNVQAELELAGILARDSRLEELDKAISAALEVATERVEELTQVRVTTARHLEGSIEAELSGLAMPFAQLRIDLAVEEDPQLWSRSGRDRATFMLAAHEGAKFLPLSRTASGGELSRVMLAIEVALAGEDPVPTMIFDEVDAGIGGGVAVEVGRRLAALAKHTQVIVVTHLPQVAAFADRHLVVEKVAQSHSVETSIARVQGEERVREITRMLSGLPDSEHGGAHALELLELGSKG